LQHRFGLTPAEITVAQQIIQADDIAAIAERPGMTLRAIKTRLSTSSPRAAQTDRLSSPGCF
jgi:hypothetical protein